MRLFYLAGVRLYGLLVHIAAGWNPRAKKWVRGRREAWSILDRFRQDQPSGNVPVYWFHCASLGEFEQGRPLIEALKQKETCSIVLTFFSPSGYEIRKNYDLADAVLYLPSDGKRNARRFLDLVQPSRIFFIKYEFWAAYIFEAEKRSIPLYSVSAVFRPNQVFFKWYGGYMRRILRAIETIFVQDDRSHRLLESIGIRSIVSGDTRYDRVMNNAARAKRFPAVDSFVSGSRVLVCGSVWQPDLEVVAPGLNTLGPEWKMIVAPHLIDESHLLEAERFFAPKEVVRYSAFKAGQHADVLLIDNIGMLMHLYGYGDLAYVGGAFKTGLHNILEPASFGLPVIFGPHHRKFPEAQLFIDHGIGYSVVGVTDFDRVLKDLSQRDLRGQVLRFMEERKGATNTILQHIAD